MYGFASRSTKYACSLSRASKTCGLSGCPVASQAYQVFEGLTMYKEDFGAEKAYANNNNTFTELIERLQKHPYSRCCFQLQLSTVLLILALRYPISTMRSWVVLPRYKCLSGSTHMCSYKRLPAPSSLPQGPSRRSLPS